MDRKYSKAEMKRILRQNISTSALTEQKIQEAYSFVRADAAMKRKPEGAYQSSTYAGQQESAYQSSAYEQPEGAYQSSAYAGQQEGAYQSSTYAGQPGAYEQRTERQNRAYARKTDGRRSASGRGRKTGRWAVLAAAMGILAVSSVTVMAINGMFSKTVEQTEDTLSYKLEFNYELTPNAIEVEAGYIPEGYETRENMGKLIWSADGSGKDGISIYLATANTLDQQPDQLDVDNVKSIEKTTINGMEAHLITLNYDLERETRTFDKRIYLFDETEGFVCIIFGGNDLSMEELVKVAEGLQFTKQEEVLEYMSAEEKEAREKALAESMEQYEQEEQARLEFGVPQEYIYDIGDSFEALDSFVDKESGISESNTTRIMVESAEIIDSVADYPQENFFDYEARIASNINEDGTASSYTRVTYSDSDDGSDPQEVARDEGVNRKFLKVTFTAENISDAAVDFWAGAPNIAYLQPVEEGNYRYAETWTEPLNLQEDAMTYENRAIYFDKSPYAGELNSHFFYCDLAAGETLEYTMLFVVDEDMLDNLYLCWGRAGTGTVIPEEGETYTERYVRINVN